MGSIKRKSLAINGHQEHKASKKAKVTRSEPEDELEKEAETDSDPIVESSTSSESGEDDGVSWPEDEEPEEFEGVEEQVDKASNAPESRQTDAPKGYEKVLARHERRTAAQAHPASTSRESHAKQKALAQERKASKPNADSVARSKKLWEQLRRKSHVPLDQRRVLIDELFSIITGHVRDYVFKHDSVRVIQTALKYANREQRRMITKELEGDYRTLAEGKYSKFLLGKMLVYGDTEIRDLIVPSFYGSVRKLINHPEAAWVLDDIYRGAASPSQKARLLREWYGPDLATLGGAKNEDADANLNKILEASPEKKMPSMKALHNLINQLVQKKKTGFTMLHDAMLQYFLNVTPGSSDFNEFLELLKGDEDGDLLKNLAFTASGSELVSLALAHGNAKDRKQILRVYKGTIQSLAFDKNGRRLLLAAYEVIDDTTLTSKSIFPELIGKTPEEQSTNLDSLIQDPNGRIPLMYLSNPHPSKSLSLPPDDQSLLTRILQIRESTSKKAPLVRRTELLTHLSPYVLPYIESHLPTLIQSQAGCSFITDTILSSPLDCTPCLLALSRLPTDSSSSSDSPDIKSALQTPFFDRMLKALILGGRYNPKTQKIERPETAQGQKLNFHDLLYAEMKKRDKGRLLMEWATGGHSFVIVALMEAEGFGAREEVMKKLGEKREELRRAADGEGKGKGNRGAGLLLEKLALPSSNHGSNKM